MAPIGAGVAAITCGLIALALQQSPHATAATLTTTTSSSTMAGMSSGSSMTGSAGMATVKGASLPSMPTSGAMPTAMPMVPLGQATWKGMKIEARTSAPATFELFDGTSQQLVRPTAKTSFHLMVLLSDASTGVAIPYSSVWATVRKGGKIVFDERLWPMISRYMGPHYGNNVSLPSAGVYQVSLLISPPQAARHLEYKNLWLKPHKVNLAFRWVPKT
ncbi:MAG TPA: iron transporter [Gaiellaceae bacterium]|nr:iron transporter [Gaiellaceae bacterium]